MEFSRQEYWSELPFPPPGDLTHPGIEPMSPALAGGFFTTSPLVSPDMCISDSLFCTVEANTTLQSNLLLFSP